MTAAKLLCGVLGMIAASLTLAQQHPFGDPQRHLQQHDALAALVPAGIIESAPVEAGDADRGRALFGRRCTGCHAIDSDREGPRLRGVYGRRAGSVPGFQYSPAVSKSGITWTEANLNRWLSDTESMLPGSAMGFSVPKAQDRADLIAFLRSLH